MTPLMITPAEREIAVQGRLIRLCNQKSPDWTYPYEYQGNGSDLHDAGCGIFALVHAVEWLHGIRIDPREAADESVRVGGRGDDGTDRPAMLEGMTASGYARRLGFIYDGGGLRNDPEELWRHMTEGHAALCNLRPGHIVALLQARISEGRRELLVIDSVAESLHPAFRDRVREIVLGSEITYPIRNEQGLTVGLTRSASMFWIDAALPRDVTLIRRTTPCAE